MTQEYIVFLRFTLHTSTTFPFNFFALMSTWLKVDIIAKREHYCNQALYHKRFMEIAAVCTQY